MTFSDTDSDLLEVIREKEMVVEFRNCIFSRGAPLDAVNIENNMDDGFRKRRRENAFYLKV